MYYGLKNDSINCIANLIDYIENFFFFFVNVINYINKKKQFKITLHYIMNESTLLVLLNINFIKPYTTLNYYIILYYDKIQYSYKMSFFIFD
jgi:hypothetical protein